jgi:replicative DNA helicase
MNSPSEQSHLHAERALLAAIIRSPEALSDAVSVLSAASGDIFAHQGHQTIWQACCDLDLEGRSISAVSVRGRVAEHGALLPELFEQPRCNAREVARIILDHWRTRRAQEAAARIGSLAQSGANAAKIAEALEREMIALGGRPGRKGFVALPDTLAETVQDIQQRASAKTGGAGIKTGYRGLDQILGGMRPGNYITLAARPAVGKTAFAVNIALRVALSGVAVGIFSQEMTARELVERILGQHAKVSGRAIRSGEISPEQMDTLDQAAQGLGGVRLFIDESSALSLAEICAGARRLKMRAPDLGLIVIDYLQLMRQGGRNENRSSELAVISSGIKSLAKELSLPIIVLSQLNRDIESRTGKDAGPRLADLKDSGSIEQDSDVVMFLTRPCKDSVEDAQLIIAKQRNGPLGNIRLLFDGDLTRFVET